MEGRKTEVEVLPDGRKILHIEEPGWPKAGDRVRVAPFAGRVKIMAPWIGKTGKLVARVPHAQYGPNGTVRYDALGQYGQVEHNDHALDELMPITNEGGTDKTWAAAAQIKAILGRLSGPETYAVLSEVLDEYCPDCCSRNSWDANAKRFSTCCCTRDD